jgi:hypothetical protein
LLIRPTIASLIFAESADVQLAVIRRGDDRTTRVDRERIPDQMKEIELNGLNLQTDSLNDQCEGLKMKTVLLDEALSSVS